MRHEFRPRFSPYGLKMRSNWGNDFSIDKIKNFTLQLLSIIGFYFLEFLGIRKNLSFWDFLSINFVISDLLRMISLDSLELLHFLLEILVKN